MITRPITRPVTSPIARAVTAGAAIWNPRALFRNGEQGWWFDNSDLSTMYQDAAGTIPVTGPGQPVGLQLDKSRGLVRGSERVTNGDFSNGKASWTDVLTTSTVSDGVITVRINNTGGRVFQTFDWTLRATPADNNWRDVIWIPERGVFVATAVSGTGQRCMTSHDGVTWSLVDTPADNNWTRMAWSPELQRLVAVSSTGTGNRAMTG